jgi:hypothetical protein
VLLQVGLVQGASNHAGRSIKRTLQRRDNDPSEARGGILEELTWFFLGEGQLESGKNRTCAPDSPPGVGVAARMEGALTQSGEPLGGSQDGSAWQRPLL